MPARFHKDDKVTLVPVRPRATGEDCSFVENDDRKHYLINFFRVSYVWAVFTRAPWYICLYSLLVLLVDLVLRTGCRYFMRLFARHVLNKSGLVGQYIDMLTYSQASICSGRLKFYSTVYCALVQTDNIIGVCDFVNDI